MCLKPINRTLLLELKRSPAVVPSGELLNELQALGLLCKPPSPSLGKGWLRRRRKRCERRCKRGKRAGVGARLRANSSRPALPSILLSNVRSLENKLDYIRLQRTTQQETRDCCVWVFTET